MPKQSEKYWYVQSDPWKLCQEKYQPEKNIYFETIFSQGNGYFNTRAYTEETTMVPGYRENYINGLMAELDDQAGKTIGPKPWPKVHLVTIPPVFAANIYICGELFDSSAGKIMSFRRVFNMKNGLLSRTLTWKSPRGRLTTLEFERFVSAENVHLAAQRIRIKPVNWTGEADITFVLDGTYPTVFRSGNWDSLKCQQFFLKPNESWIENNLGIMEMKIKGTGHRLTMVSSVSHAPGRGTWADGTRIKQTVQHAVAPDRTLEVERTVVMMTSMDNIGARAVTARAVAMAKERLPGFNRLLEASTQVWARRWADADIEINGPVRDQKIVRFNIFHLLQVTPVHSDRVNIPARGAFSLYQGLYFWDTEIFMLPFHIFTMPQAARNLLAFRYHTLPGARINAAKLRFKGASFPFMSDSVSGTEQTPGDLGNTLPHVSADIAYGVDQYVRAANDLKFMAECGLTILVETARNWVSRAIQDGAGRFHIDRACGPDEFAPAGRDNGYTNLMAKNNIALAGAWLEELKKTYPYKIKSIKNRLKISRGEIKQWQKVSQGLYIPEIPDIGIPLQDQAFLSKAPIDIEASNLRKEYKKWKIRDFGKYRIIKQADIILAMFLLEDKFSREEIEKAYDFYEPCTMHLSSLSYSTHALVAARLDRTKQAYEYFMKSAGLDIDDIKGATADGIHTASLGGTWQALIFGFCGLTLQQGRLVFRGHLPARWKSVKFTAYFRGQRLDFQVMNEGR